MIQELCPAELGETQGPSALYPVLHYNGKRYFPIEHADALTGARIHGYYRRNADRGYYLFDNKQNLSAYLVQNQVQGHFAVTAWKVPEGIWHMFSTTQETERFLGIDTLGFADSCAAARDAALQEEAV